MLDKSDWLIDCITNKIALFIVEDECKTPTEALKEIYNSKIYRKLSDKRTDLYTQSPAYVYQYYLQEKMLPDNGKITASEVKD